MAFLLPENAGPIRLHGRATILRKQNRDQPRLHGLAAKQDKRTEIFTIYILGASARLRRADRAFRSNLFYPLGKKGFPLQSLAPHGLFARLQGATSPLRVPCVYPGRKSMTRCEKLCIIYSEYV
jgi:hypothetical protein